MYKFLESILHMTAWPMTPPAPYSAFHILLTIFGTGLAVLLARILSKKGPREYASLSHNRTQTKTAPESYLRRVLFFLRCDPRTHGTVQAGILIFHRI